MDAPNVVQAVPFLRVPEMAKALAFYVDGLGGKITRQWDVEGQIRWCWIELGGASLMLQTLDAPPASPLGTGVSLCFQCQDAIALYREFTGRGLEAKRPFVGNGFWVTTLTDPFGYRIEFESPTTAAEESVWDGDAPGASAR